MRRVSLPLLFSLAASLAAGPAVAGIIDSFDNGQYRSDGLHSAGNAAIFTGWTFGGSPFPATYEYRGFLAFNAAGSGPASSISLTIRGIGELRTDTGEETVHVYDYTGSVTSLVAGSTTTNPFGDQAYADLGSGERLGAHTFTGADRSTMPEVTIQLPQEFVTQFNEALLGDGLIAVGLRHITGDAFTNQGLWGTGGSGVVPMAYLNVVEIPPIAAVPVPETGYLLGAGLLLLLARRQRDRAA